VRTLDASEKERRDLQAKLQLAAGKSKARSKQDKSLTRIAWESRPRVDQWVFSGSRQLRDTGGPAFGLLQTL